MAQPESHADQQSALFVSLVMMLSTSAMQQLGKLVDPETNKTEVNLEAAQVSIDMIEMLKQKMQGNLSDRESRMLDDILSSLQINYVDVKKRGGQAERGAEEENEAEQRADQPDQAERTEQTGPSTPADTPPARGEHKDPRFHKTYGG
jgi:hypothetical protein